MAGVPAAFAIDLVDALAAAPAEDREEVVRQLQWRRGVKTLYVTDLTLGEAMDLVSDRGLPSPYAYVAAGGSVVWSERVRPFLGSLLRDLADCWPGDHLVRGLIDRLELPVEAVEVSSSRVTYRLTEGTSLVESMESIRDTIHSHGADVRFRAPDLLDVMAAGVSKGTTLLRVLDLLGIPRSRTLVGGHLLEDWALLKSRLSGFALPDVGPVTETVVKMEPHLHLTRSTGSTGVLEGLNYLI